MFIMLEETYQIFFELRKQYPDKLNLIAELMRFFFEHFDSFPETIYLNGLFNEDDVILIMKELHIDVKKAFPTLLRSIPTTIITLQTKKP